MALSTAVLLGLTAALFVGVNIGGSSTGVAFGPATGSGVVSKRGAAGLMALFALAGGAIVGPNVVETLGTEFVPPEAFSLAASAGVLLFTGMGILVGNLLRVSTSTSETAVGAVVGMGIALGVLNYATVGLVMMWWFVAPMFGFWVSAFVARYFEGPVLSFFGEDGPLPRRVRELLVIGVGCYMAFSAGASNVANAVAPLVGGGVLDMLTAVLVGGGAIGVGAFVLGPRTMETVGNEITELPLEGALFVEVLAASIITFLSAIGIPASLAITMTSCVMGFGWGRAMRRFSVGRMLGIPGEAAYEEGQGQAGVMDIYSVDTTRRIVATWFATPVLAGLLAVGAFRGARLAGLV